MSKEGKWEEGKNDRQQWDKDAQARGEGVHDVMSSKGVILTNCVDQDEWWMDSLDETLVGEMDDWMDEETDEGMGAL